MTDQDRRETESERVPDASSSSQAAHSRQERAKIGFDPAGIVVHDVDELVGRLAELTAENALLAEQVAARDSFLAVAAHELKNALTPVVGRLAMLRSRIAAMTPEKVRGSLDQIEQATAMFARRATTLLDVSRMTSGKLQLNRVAVDIGKVAHAIVDGYRPLAERAGSELALDIPDAALVVSGDQVAIEQIFDNLISNAIKYGGGTPIGVSARRDAAARVVRFSVSDKGPGISSESQARIFERFERAVRPGEDIAGFGVGLWVVKQLSEAMGGTVDVTSVSGAGSTFCITLPLSSEMNPQ